MSRPRRVAASLLVVAAVLLAARYLTSVSVRSVSYWIIDDQTLGVMVLGGVGDSCALVRAEETADEVRVVAECREPFVWLGRPLLGIPHDFVVTLGQPIAARRVVDGFGNPAEHCPLARCGRPA
jgi:hypothetical protein